jgi:hypothetical protein
MYQKDLPLIEKLKIKTLIIKYKEVRKERTGEEINLNLE